jgi:GNAT superfamily N-acetyltransferase
VHEADTTFRQATAPDLESVVETITSAFYADPTWSWAFPDPAARARQHAAYWRVYIEAAFRQGGVWVTRDCEAATIWIPPGGEELSAAEEDRATTLLRTMLGAHAEAVIELNERFDAAHPRDQAHWYLTLFGTHSRHRGKGLGMALLRNDLERIDESATPAYLESTNPANDQRYAAVGFERTGSFTTPDDTHVVTTMWRKAATHPSHTR